MSFENAKAMRADRRARSIGFILLDTSAAARSWDIMRDISVSTPKKATDDAIHKLLSDGYEDSIYGLSNTLARAITILFDTSTHVRLFHFAPRQSFDLRQVTTPYRHAGVGAISLHADKGAFSRALQCPPTIISLRAARMMQQFIFMPYYFSTLRLKRLAE